MTDLLSPNGEFERHRRMSQDHDQLPTPSSTPLLGSPLLGNFTPTEEPLYESLEERLHTSTDLSDHARSIDADILIGSTTKPSTSKPSSHRPSNGERKRSISGKLGSPRIFGSERSDKVLKLSPQELKELASERSSLPIRRESPLEETPFSAPPYPQANGKVKEGRDSWQDSEEEVERRGRPTANRTRRNGSYMMGKMKETGQPDGEKEIMTGHLPPQRPGMPARTVSTPPLARRKTSSKSQTSKEQTSRDVLSPKKQDKNLPSPLNLKDSKFEKMNGRLKPSPMSGSVASPMPTSALPLPPMSIPIFLQLELDSHEPSPLYIHRSSSVDFPYESSAVKFERLENFLKLPANLEGVLLFGSAACMDAWLYTMTILPLRFLKALGILGEWWARNAWKEVCDLVDFVYLGVGRLWKRSRRIATHSGQVTPSNGDTRSRSTSNAMEIPPAQKEARSSSNGLLQAWPEPPQRIRKSSTRKHRRSRSTPSLLLPNHKADLLKGFLIICSCYVLMYLDPSRMYHKIRGQAAIKLYVIYNMLEVADKLLGSIGQDVLECLFSQETLERNSDGRSKILRPFWLFVLALTYNVCHAAVLFYQVITLNVAVNSYSNALLTLLMSNQFVEIKGAVFKKFEKENLFQMCCADVVERFQLLLMLLIIGMRNIVEVGGLSISLSNTFASPTNPPPSNGTGLPFSSSAILPKSFNFLPSFPGKVLAPFLIVIGSEMLVDWLKYAYIGKFNNYKPNIFGRFFDVFAKDYYTNAFADQNLTRRIGLPVFPLTCLFVRASVQTYHMLLATHLPAPLPSPITGIAVENSPSSTPATTAALAHIDKLFRRALGRSGFENTASAWSWWSFDDVVAFSTTILLVLVIYLLLLSFKLVWGMFLLALSRRRYMGMKMRENMAVDSEGKRVGGWGTVEVGDERRRWIYEGDEEGLRKMKERERKAEEKKEGKVVDYGKIIRYDMVAKRIW